MPVRHGRMMVSPFTFYRGGAKIMAADLAPTPVPVCTYSSAVTRTSPTSACSCPPERTLLFDLNDFDERCPVRSSGT